MLNSSVVRSNCSQPRDKTQTTPPSSGLAQACVHDECGGHVMVKVKDRTRVSSAVDREQDWGTGTARAAACAVSGQ
eukprot:2624291-Rhodomonas_salina.2